MFSLCWFDFMFFNLPLQSPLPFLMNGSMFDQPVSRSNTCIRCTLTRVTLRLFVNACPFYDFGSHIYILHLSGSWNFRLAIILRVAFLFRKASGRFYPQRETSVYGLRGSSSQGRQRPCQCLPDRCCCLAGLSGSSTFLLPCIPNVAAEKSPQSTELLALSFLFLAWCARLHVSLPPKL